MASNEATNAVTLFDAVDRSGTEPAAYAEPMFRYWNRSARRDIDRVRLELEQWFSRYPSEHASDLRSRFRSMNDAQHRGAFFELFLFELFSRLGYRIEVHPALPGTSKRPEFKLTDEQDRHTYVEARVVTDESDEDAGARMRLNDLYDALDGVESPDFWIAIEPTGVPKTQLSSKHLKSFLRSEIDRVDYDSALTTYLKTGFTDLRRSQFEFDGGKLTIFLIPKGDARGDPDIRPLGLRFDPPHFVDSVGPIRRALLEKAKKYGSPDAPFIIAVNALGESVDEEDFVEALFGSVEYLIRNMQAHPVRSPNGLWTDSKGQYTRVSAVVMFTKLHPHNFPSKNAILFHHPKPTFRVEGAACSLPQRIVRADRLDVVEGRSLADIFGLPGNWLDGADDD